MCCLCFYSIPKGLSEKVFTEATAKQNSAKNLQRKGTPTQLTQVDAKCLCIKKEMVSRTAYLMNIYIFGFINVYFYRMFWSMIFF